MRSATPRKTSKPEKGKLWSFDLDQQHIRSCPKPVGLSQELTEENMRALRIAFVGGFAGGLMASNVATLQAAPLPTNVASMKLMVADSSIQVRWSGGRGYRGFRGWGYRGWGAGALACALVGGAISRAAHIAIVRAGPVLRRLQLLSGLRRLWLGSNPRTRGR